MLVRLAVLVCAAAAVASCEDHYYPAGSEGVTQHADLAYWFNCESRADARLESKLIDFLKHQGFKTLNLGAIDRTRGIRIDDLSITALDADRRVILIHASPGYPGEQSVGLYTEPPTHRATQLEASLLAFTSTGLGCTNVRISRGENDSTGRDFHDSDVERILGLFKEAKELGIPGA